jgi:hypothetical protein
MAMGRFAVTSGAISSNTTTDLITPVATEAIYVFWVGVDVSVAGTTSTAQIKGQTTARTIGLFNTTAVGHQESFTGTGFKEFVGFPIPMGEKLQVVTAGGAAATLTVSVLYEIRGGAF